jgi:hypothetical protein
VPIAGVLASPVPAKGLLTVAGVRLRVVEAAKGLPDLEGVLAREEPWKGSDA